MKIWNSEHPDQSAAWLLDQRPGFRRMAHCLACASVVDFPIENIIAANGAAKMLSRALADLRCPVCAAGKVGVTTVRN